MSVSHNTQSKYKMIPYGEVAERLLQNQIGLLPVDTIYGISGIAFNPEAVERIYQVKKRDNSKPFIVLINDISQLELFEIQLSKNLQQLLTSKWPGPNTFILDLKPHVLDKFSYLHRGHNTLALRVPLKPDLQNVLSITGPVISTSANINGNPHVTTALDGIHIFGDELDFYVDEGELHNPPSSIFRVDSANSEIIKIR